MALSPLNQRRWRNFRQNRRAFWSLIILAFLYGISLFGIELKADNPAQFHRGWPGVGFTHSMTFGVVIGLLLYLGWRNAVVAYSFVLGQWAHALTDTGDTPASERPMSRASA